MRPTGVARPFGPEEIIVSKTDPKGLLTYVNDVFVRVSGFTEEELLGRPHNVIRHPQMPRAVFRLLWDTITAGDELFFYAVNLAQDGGHYWVLAHVTPTRDAAGVTTGYHSNRRWAAPSSIRTVEALYREVLAAEKRQTRTPDALAAGSAALEQALQRRGQTFAELVWALAADDEHAAESAR